MYIVVLLNSHDSRYFALFCQKLMFAFDYIKYKSSNECNNEDFTLIPCKMENEKQLEKIYQTLSEKLTTLSFKVVDCSKIIEGLHATVVLSFLLAEAKIMKNF